MTSNVTDKFSFDEISALKVSNHTAEWVKVYMNYQKLWEQITDLLENEYGNSVDDLFKKRFEQQMLHVGEEILNGIRDSIWMSFGERNRNNIL
jgi:hypothetical protein